jgi:hypothetical protein
MFMKEKDMKRKQVAAILLSLSMLFSASMPLNAISVLAVENAGVETTEAVAAPEENNNEGADAAEAVIVSEEESAEEDARETTEAAATEEERPRHPRVEIPEDQATSIFISIGKNRRVYPRDLVGILIAIAGIDRERIGDIKVLANYSFVQLYTEDAQTAIDKLNGYDYRGRKLAVSYSRQKSDADAEGAATEAETAESQTPYSAEEAEMAAEDAAAYAAAEKAAADKEPFGVN